MVNDGAVGAKGSVVETGEQSHPPWWTAEIRFGDFALKSGSDKFLEKVLDSVPPGVLPGPPMIAICESQNCVAVIGPQQWAVVPGVERPDVAP